jgi:hypothetical protein
MAARRTIREKEDSLKTLIGVFSFIAVVFVATGALAVVRHATSVLVFALTSLVLSGFLFRHVLNVSRQRMQSEWLVNEDGLVHRFADGEQQSILWSQIQTIRAGEGQLMLLWSESGERSESAGTLNETYLRLSEEDISFLSSEWAKTRKA